MEWDELQAKTQWFKSEAVRLEDASAELNSVASEFAAITGSFSVDMTEILDAFTDAREQILYRDKVSLAAGSGLTRNDLAQKIRDTGRHYLLNEVRNSEESLAMIAYIQTSGL